MAIAELAARSNELIDLELKAEYAPCAVPAAVADLFEDEALAASAVVA